VRERVCSAVGTGDPILVLGGDCTLLLGVVAGIQDEGDVGVAYVDGDADLDLPGSGWGVFDSMGAAHLIGRGEPRLSGLGARTPLVQERHLALFGYHPAQLSPAQSNLLDALAVRALPVTDMPDPVGAALAVRSAMEAEVDHLVVHFDVDVIDFAELPLADCPRYHGGLPFDVAMEVLAILTASTLLRAVTITEVNPTHDPDDRLVPRLVAGVAGALGRALSR
jgi:arginase